MDENYDIESIDNTDYSSETDMIDDTDDNLSYISNCIISNDETYINSSINNNNTSKYMTKFELTSILSIRTQQIARGSPLLIELSDNITDPFEIAKLELQQNKCPLIIRRYDSNHKYIDVKINDLIIKHDY